jgi:hypothetical protein
MHLSLLIFEDPLYPCELPFIFFLFILVIIHVCDPLLARVERPTEKYLLSAVLVTSREGAGPLFDQVCWCLLIL